MKDLKRINIPRSTPKDTPEAALKELEDILNEMAAKAPDEETLVSEVSFITYPGNDGGWPLLVAYCTVVYPEITPELKSKENPFG